MSAESSRGAVLRNVAAFLVGLLFAGGLALSGMTQPEKVVSFFDFSQGLTSWDPSLAFVMGAGLLVYTPAFRWFSRRKQPLLDVRFRLPTRKDVDARLIGGAAIFGLGWGLAGYCPGPALTSLGALQPAALPVVLGMLAGMFGFQTLERAREKRALGKAKPKGPGSAARKLQVREGGAS